MNQWSGTHNDLLLILDEDNTFFFNKKIVFNLNKTTCRFGQ
jgi:hypothetical protein